MIKDKHQCKHLQAFRNRVFSEGHGWLSHSAGASCWQRLVKGGEWKQLNPEQTVDGPKRGNFGQFRLRRKTCQKSEMLGLLIQSDCFFVENWHLHEPFCNLAPAMQTGFLIKTVRLLPSPHLVRKGQFAMKSGTLMASRFEARLPSRPGLPQPLRARRRLQRGICVAGTMESDAEQNKNPSSS